MFSTALLPARKYNSISFEVDTPEGNMFIHFLEDVNDNTPQGMHIHVGKSGGAVQAWATAVAELITVSIQHDVSLIKIMEMLSNNTTSRSKINWRAGTIIKSGVEGISYAIKQYLRFKYESKYPEERRNGPSMEF